MNRIKSGFSRRNFIKRGLITGGALLVNPLVWAQSSFGRDPMHISDTYTDSMHIEFMGTDNKPRIGYLQEVKIENEITKETTEPQWVVEEPDTGRHALFPRISYYSLENLIFTATVSSKWSMIEPSTGGIPGEIITFCLTHTKLNSGESHQDPRILFLDWNLQPCLAKIKELRAPLSKLQRPTFSIRKWPGYDPDDPPFRRC